VGSEEITANYSALKLGRPVKKKEGDCTQDLKKGASVKE